MLRPDAWLAGEGDAWAWLYLPAHPVPSSKLEGYGHDGREQVVVRAVDAVTTVVAGDFGDCVEVSEEEDDPDELDIVLYAPGMGRVSESSGSGRIELVKAKPGAR